MTNEAYQATPRHVLEHQIMSPGEGKNEREWWACHEIEKLRVRIAELEAALKFYADEDNWRRNGPLDPNSANFTGGPATAALKEKGK